jgi:hypothetical protein
LLQERMRQLPQRRVRRNFTLDPALYGRPQRETLVQVYPVLRTATALAAFLFIFVLAANLFLGGAGELMSEAQPAMAPFASDEAMIAETPLGTAAEEPLEEAVEETYAVEEEAAEEALMMEEEAELVPAPPFEEAPVESELDGPLIEAESSLEEPAADPNMAVPLDRESLTDMQEADVAAAERAPAIAPTMTAESAPVFLPTRESETVDDGELGGDLAAADEAEMLESYPEPEPKLVEEIAQDQELEPVTTGSEVREREGIFTAISLGGIALLLGVVLVILILLTLLARRRL